MKDLFVNVSTLPEFRNAILDQLNANNPHFGSKEEKAAKIKGFGELYTEAESILASGQISGSQYDPMSHFSLEQFMAEVDYQLRSPGINVVTKPEGLMCADDVTPDQIGVGRFLWVIGNTEPAKDHIKGGLAILPVEPDVSTGEALKHTFTDIIYMGIEHPQFRNKKVTVWQINTLHPKASRGESKVASYDELVSEIGKTQPVVEAYKPLLSFK